MTDKLDSTLLFDDLILVNYLKEIKSPFQETVKTVFNNVKDVLDIRIPAIFPNYTLHNTGHSFRIINYMSKIVDDYRKLSELEIAMLICAALLHDVGMAVSEEDMEAIKNDNFSFSEIKFSAMLRLLEGDETGHPGVCQTYPCRAFGSFYQK